MPAIQDPRFYPRYPLQGVTKTPDKAKEPRTPTAGRMKKPPVSGGLPVSWAAAGELTRLRLRGVW